MADKKGIVTIDEMWRELNKLNQKPARSKPRVVKKKRRKKR